MSFEPPSIRGLLKKFLPHLLEAQEQNLNEADTAHRVVAVLQEVLGYDSMSEISRETMIKGKYVDMAVKLGSAIKFLVETKAAGTALHDRHIDQARHYAADGNITWVLLTNGVEWDLYHLTFDEGIDYDRAFSLDLSKDEIGSAAETLGLLHRESVRRDMLEDFWRRASALNPQSLGKALFTESVLRLLRREIRRANGVFIEEEKLVSAMKGLFSAEIREAMGPIKIRRRRRRKKLPAQAPAAKTEAPVAAGKPEAGKVQKLPGIEGTPAKSATAGDGSG